MLAVQKIHSTYKKQFSVIDIRSELAQVSIQPEHMRKTLKSQKILIQKLEDQIQHLKKTISITQNTMAMLEDDYRHVVELMASK
jgi:hypothetical protein